MAFSNHGLTNLIFDVRGRIVPLIEFLPFPAFFVATYRGQAKEAAVQIINHDTEPLYLGAVEHASKRFTTELKTVEEGQRYALTLRLDGNGPPGKASETLQLITSNRKRAVVRLQANTYIKERVYVSPDAVDLGRIRVHDLKATPALTNYLSQILMTYQHNGTNFDVTAKTDLSFIDLSAERSKLKDRYQITVAVIPQRLTDSRVDGRIILETNDKEFPALEVSVQGIVEGVW